MVEVLKSERNWTGHVMRGKVTLTTVLGGTVEKKREMRKDETEDN